VSFQFIPVDKDREKLIEIASNCGSEVNWETDWASASKRARDEDKLVLVVFEVYQGLLSHRFSLARLFMFTDIIEIIEHRFVPIFWTREIGAPFDDPKVFGLGPSILGNALMFANHKGKIVGQATTLNSYHVYDKCLEMLKVHPGKTIEDTDVQTLIQRGDLEAAENLLAKSDEPESRLAGSLARRKRIGEKAKRAYGQAEDSKIELALVHLNLGEYRDASKLLKNSKEPRGIFFRCVAKAVMENVEAVRSDLRELALDNPKNRWGWLAAAIVTEARQVGILGLFTWPEDAQFTSWNIPDYEAAECNKKATEATVKFLLESQGEDGRWVNPRTAQGKIFDVAVSSICGCSLMSRKKDPKVLEALKKTNDYVHEHELIANHEALFDYAVWAQIFALKFLAACNDNAIGSKTKNLKMMNAIIENMHSTQYQSGGWGYFHHADTPDNSIGFVTAAAMLSLQHAEKAGAKLPAMMLDNAAKSVAALRHSSGSFGYMTSTGKSSLARQAESAQRSPLYALALKRAEKTDEKTVRKALDVYLKHRKHVIKERGKSICHTGPEATAAYYLLFGYRFAAEAVLELPEAEQSKYRDALLKDVRQFRLSDGSYMDYQSVGREYGAAMALTTFDLLSK
jgi:hypothetical protein